jgi:flagellar motor switch protein FliG
LKYEQATGGFGRRSREGRVQIDKDEVQTMVAHFGNLVDEVRKLSIEEKEELKFLIEKYLAEERRKEIYDNYQESLKESRAVKLHFSHDLNNLKKSLADR